MLVLVVLNGKIRCHRIAYCVFPSRGKLNDETINDFFTYLERSFSDINCLTTPWYLDCKKKKHYRKVVKLAFDKEEVMSKTLYIPVNENKNHWILVIVFPKSKLVISYEPLKTDFRRRTRNNINVFNELL